MEATTTKQIIFEQINDYLRYCRNRQQSEKTIDMKRRTLIRFARITKIDSMSDCTNESVERWIEVLSAGSFTGVKSKGSTINNRLAYLKAFITYLRDCGVAIPLRLSLVGKVKEKPARRNWFTREQIETVLANAKPLARMLIALAFDSGLRSEELRTLRLSNISGRRIDIVGKGGKAGTLFMTRRTRVWLDDWIESQHITDYLWPSRRCAGRPLSKTHLDRLTTEAFESVGISDFHMHALRHSFATDIQLRGASLLQAQKLLRHASSATTEIYLHGFDLGLNDIYDQLKGQ